ncbi:MAG TPA: rod shape-determining protein RodA [Solirubrobacterales bacterium]|jgi:rod shape determining protein RodA|nr:rod shape-determining protein RodA [Solirubrobacterales bacterium]
MMYATRARQARPEPFAVRPGIAERLGLPYMDAPLALAAIALAAFSVFALSQATLHDVPGDPRYYVDRQALYGALGLAGMYLLTRIDYSRFRELRVGIYTFLCVSISLVFVFGFAARGSRRAFDLPFFSFQPSELGKVLLVLALAGFMIDGARNGSERQRTLRYLCLGLAPAVLVFLQPDLGTSLVLGAITLAVMYVGGVRWTHFAAIAAAFVALTAAVLVVAPAVGTPVLKGYQEQRLTSFLHPSADPANAGYQQNQAKIAIGSGEMTGRGDRATQTRLDFVPERSTDFIFAVIGERYGFLGAALVLSLYALLIWRALRIVTLSKNSYGTLVAGGIAGMLLFQVFVNVGMNLGIMPITGIPLPLMSYGGSSVLATFLAIGVLQSIHMQARLSQKGRFAR